MSPRRRVDPNEEVPVYVEPPRWWPNPLPLLWQRRRDWALSALVGVTAVVVVAAIAVSALMLVLHEQNRRQTLRDAEAVDFVRSFMTEYTTLDPFHANDYADRIFAETTGDFAKQYKERMNEVVVEVARNEPTTGEVVAAGVEEWHDDGSVSVLVAAKATSTSADGKSLVEDGSRWVVTAVKEGQQWKISQLSQVI